MTQVNFNVNRQSRVVEVSGEDTLLDTLRDNLGLLGTKEGCLEGECGACTVLVDGKPIDSCIYATAACAGREVVTIEGIGSGDELSALQRAFVNAGSIQCGFCTPGFVMTLTALLETNPSPSRADVQDALSGNICRCTGYSQIIDAVVDVVMTQREAGVRQS